MPRSADPAAYPAGSDPAFTLTGGPAGATAATLAALGRPILHHLDPAFGVLYAETVELLRRAFDTGPSPAILQGEAVVGLEAAAASLIGAGDVVLNLVSGMYGRGYGDWARRYAREVIEIEVPYDSAVPAASVAAAFRGRPDITIVSVVHCETPCGTVNAGQGDLAGIVLQIGHMGPAACPLSPVIAVTAIGRALRALGAKADIGAAVEAAVSALSLCQ